MTERTSERAQKSRGQIMNFAAFQNLIFLHTHTHYQVFSRFLICILLHIFNCDDFFLQKSFAQTATMSLKLTTIDNGLILLLKDETHTIFAFSRILTSSSKVTPKQEVEDIGQDSSGAKNIWFSSRS